MERNLSEDKCAVCEGSCQFVGTPCVYCNGTGEENNVATAYVKNHICQCIMWNREWCPVCKKKCHHDTSFSPKQKIEPGPGGILFIETSTTDETSTKTEEVVA